MWTHWVGLKTILNILLMGSKGLKCLKTHICMHQMTTRISIRPCGPSDTFRHIQTHSVLALKTHWVQLDLAGLTAIYSQKCGSKTGLNPQLAGVRGCVIRPFQKS